MSLTMCPRKNGKYLVTALMTETAGIPGEWELWNWALRFKCQLCRLLAVWPWASHFPYLSFSPPLTCKMNIIIVLMSWGCWEDSMRIIGINECKAQCSACRGYSSKVNYWESERLALERSLEHWVWCLSSLFGLRALGSPRTLDEAPWNATGI